MRNSSKQGRHNKHTLKQFRYAEGESNPNECSIIPKEPLLAAYLLGIYIANELYYLTGIHGLTTIVYLLLGLFVLLRAITRRSVLIREYHCLFPLVLTALLVLLTVYRPSYSSVSAVHIAVFVIMPFLLICEEFDSVLALRWILVFSALLLPSAYLLRITQEDAWTMPLSYALATPVVASIVLLRYKSEPLTLVERLLVSLSAAYFLFILLYGKRGPILVVVVTALLVFVKSPNSIHGITKSQTVALLLVGVTLFFTLTNVEAIIRAVAAVVSRFGIEISSIERTLSLSSTQYGVFSGRGELFSAALSRFKDSPIYGHGIGSFYFINSGGHEATYPHNFVLELLVDGGLIFALLVVVPVLRGFIEALGSNNPSAYILFVFLFSLAIPHFLVSSEIYHQPELWCLLAYSHYFNSSSGRTEPN